MLFTGFYKIYRRTNRPTDQPTSDYLPTDPPTQQLAESITIFEGIDNRNIFILQNTNTAGKTCNGSSVYCPKSLLVSMNKSSHLEVFLGKGVLKLRSKFTGEYPCRSAIQIKFRSNIIEIALRHGCSPVNLLHIFRTPFLKNTSGRLLLHETHTKESIILSF